MKKIKNIILLLTLSMLLTGCVKFNAEMDIKKDKSMDFSIIYALDTSLFGETEIFKDEDLEKLERDGFKVEKYEKNNMKGLILSTNIKNIDTISSDKDTKYSLSGIMNSDENKEKSYMFKIKKGFLKNKYTASFDFNAEDSGLNTDLEDLDGTTTFDDENDLVDTPDDDINDNNDAEDDDSDFNLFDPDMDFSSAMTNLDLSFNVNLPYKALSHNADKTNNDNKSLSWSLSSNAIETIEFEFELYNKTNIIILIISGVVLLIVVSVIIFITLNKRKNKGTAENIKSENNNTNNTNIPAENINQNIESSPNVNMVTPTETINNNNLIQNNETLNPNFNSEQIKQQNIINTSSTQNLQTPNINPNEVNVNNTNNNMIKPNVLPNDSNRSFINDANNIQNVNTLNTNQNYMENTIINQTTNETNPNLNEINNNKNIDNLN